MQGTFQGFNIALTVNELLQTENMIGCILIANFFVVFWIKFLLLILATLNLILCVKCYLTPCTSSDML